MPNKNYIKGRRKEYAIVKEAKAKGNLAFRSAGSHSCVDVVVIDVKNREIQLIQSKPNDISELEIKRLEFDNKDLNGLYIVKYIIK
jgi:Holliday junction resolvase